MIGTKIISGVDASREEKLGPKTGNRVFAASGYIVVSVGHAYEASSLLLEDGAVIKLDNSIKSRQI